MAKLTEQGRKKIPENEWKAVEADIDRTIKAGGLEEDDTYVPSASGLCYLVYGEDFTL